MKGYIMPMADGGLKIYILEGHTLPLLIFPRQQKDDSAKDKSFNERHKQHGISRSSLNRVYKIIEKKEKKDHRLKWIKNREEANRLSFGLFTFMLIYFLTSTQ